MEDLRIIGEFVRVVAILLAYITAVLVLAIADAAMTLLLFRWSSKIKKASELPQPEVPLPQLPPDHQVVVLGGGIKRWD